jgi:hypothetical protein
MYITRIYFGRNVPTGGTVSDDDWFDFETQYLTFECYTVIPAQGVWVDAATGMQVRETTMIVELAHSSAEDYREDILSAAHGYKGRFRQDAVLITTTTAEVEFI